VRSQIHRYRRAEARSGSRSFDPTSRTDAIVAAANVADLD
jgi:hypothetical protein